MDAAFKEFSKSVLKEKAAVPTMAQEIERFKDIAKDAVPNIPILPKDKTKDEVVL
jgi:hypothetical protein